MGADELDINGTEAVSDSRYQSVIVALDVKDNPAAFENARVAKLLLDVSWAGPGSLLGFVGPSQEWLFGIRAFFPEGFQMARGDYSHGDNFSPVLGLMQEPAYRRPGLWLGRTSLPSGWCVRLDGAAA